MSKMDSNPGLFLMNKSTKKIVVENNKIIGCIMLGDPKGFNKITKAMSEKLDVSQIKDQILSAGFDPPKADKG